MSELKKLPKNDMKSFSDLPTKSAKIRFLNSHDWTRSEISKHMQIRYQHVRNVLITPVKNPRS